MKIEISLVILTHKRPEFLNFHLYSLSKYNFKGLEIIIVENGSDSITEKVIKSYANRLNIFHVQISKNSNPAKWITAATMQASGKIVAPFCGDDDFLFRGTLELVSEAFRDPHVTSVAGYYLRYDLISHSVVENQEFQKTKESQPLLTQYKAGSELVDKFCYVWGIGTDNLKKAPPMSHSSCTFIRKDVLVETINRQSSLFLGPFGDVGLLGTLYHQETIHFIAKPLVLLCQGHSKQLNALSSDLDAEFAHCTNSTIKFSPFKSHTFQNLGVESHLTLLHSYNEYDSKRHKLNDEFIANHLSELLSSKKFAINFDEEYELIKRYLIADIPVDKHKDSLNELEKIVHSLKKHSASESLNYGKSAEITYAELVDNISPLLFSYIN